MFLSQPRLGRTIEINGKHCPVLGPFQFACLAIVDQLPKGAEPPKGLITPTGHQRPYQFSDLVTKGLLRLLPGNEGNTFEVTAAGRKALETGVTTMEAAWYQGLSDARKAAAGKRLLVAGERTKNITRIQDALRKAKTLPRARAGHQPHRARAA